MKEERAKRLEQEIKRDRGGWTLWKRHSQLTDSPFTSPGQTLSQECADIPKAKPSPAACFKDFWHSHQMPGKHNLGAPLVPAAKLTSFLEDRPSSSLPSPEASSEPGGDALPTPRAYHGKVTHAVPQAVLAKLTPQRPSQ